MHIDADRLQQVDEHQKVGMALSTGLTSAGPFNDEVWSPAPTVFWQ
jgi:hypothetical protein